MNKKLCELKAFVLKMGSESGNTDVFFDELLLREIKEKTNEYMFLLMQSKKPLSLNPLVESNFSNQVCITPSSRTDGEWQVTIFKQGEPLGHKEYRTFEEAVKDNALEWFTQGLWSESIC